MTSSIISPIKDVLVAKGNPGGNYSTYEDIRIKDEAHQTCRALLQFEVSGYPKLTAATLYVYFHESSWKKHAGKQVNVCKLNNDTWPAAAVSWKNQPAESGAAAVVLYPAGYGWVTWDLLELTDAAIFAGDDLSIIERFNAEDLAAGYDQCYQYSTRYGDKGYHPYLLLEFAGAGGGGGSSGGIVRRP